MHCDICMVLHKVCWCGDSCSEYITYWCVIVLSSTLYATNGIKLSVLTILAYDKECCGVARKRKDGLMSSFDARVHGIKPMTLFSIGGLIGNIKKYFTEVNVWYCGFKYLSVVSTYTFKLYSHFGKIWSSNIDIKYTPK